ncbi:hypothetical protein D3C81_1847320 [compost metagenome]
MALCGRLQRTDVGLFIADIGHGDLGLPALGTDFFLHALQRLNAAPAQHHCCALFGETQCSGFADAGTGAGNERNFSL